MIHHIDRFPVSAGVGNTCGHYSTSEESLVFKGRISSDQDLY